MTGPYYDERRPEQIEDDIEYTRAEISETLDAIERRLSPSQLVDQAINYFSSGPGEFGSNLGRQIRENPIPVALIGIGLAWLMLSGQRERRRHPSYAAPPADRYSPRSRLWDEGYGDPYRTYGDERRFGGAYEPYAEDYDRYEDYEPYGAYDEDEEERAAPYATGAGAWARRRAGVHREEEPAPGGGPRDPLSARVDPLSSAAEAPPAAGERTDTAEELGRPSTTTTTHRTTEERL